MPRIRQLAGLDAGKIIDVSVVVARAMINQGTGRWPDEVPTPKATVPEVPKPMAGYTIKAKGPAWADVIGPDGQPVNERPLRRKRPTR